MDPRLQADRIERLVGLCKLWGAVKFFHPYLAYRQDIDWDAALITTIPKVYAARETSEYATAVQDMLMYLGDPVTQLIANESAEVEMAGHEPQPTYTFTTDQILVIQIHDYKALSDFYAVQQRMEAIKEEIPQARGILFDLRSNAPLIHERGYLTSAFRSNDIASMLTSIAYVTAGERSRMHTGFVAKHGDSLYNSALKVEDGRRILPAPGARDVPIVFLINSWSELPPESVALQTAGKAAIVAEGSANDSSLVKTHLIQLSDGVLAQMRLGEIVYPDGTGGFHPDIILPESRILREGDPALTAALDLLKDFKPGKTRQSPLAAYAVPPAEDVYPEMAFPTLEYRLLAAFRIWTTIHYFFPYKHLMNENWEEVLRDFIPRMETADGALDYHLAVAEMITHIHDSHGTVDSQTLKDYFGAAWPPIRLQIIDGSPVIIAILDEDAAQMAGVRTGDVLLKVDGEDALERMEYRSKFLAGSKPHRRLFRSANASLSGPEGSMAVLTIRDREMREREVALPRKSEYSSNYPAWRSGEVIRLLEDDIGYADLDRLEVSMVDEMFERFRDTRAIIFDMRGYPKGTAWAIAPRLAGKNGVRAALFHCPVVLTPDGASGDIEDLSMAWSFVQSIPFTDKWRYQGKTVMLIDERTQSQAEHTGLFFEAANNTKFIGSPTSGANGNVTNFFVPGGSKIWFTGISVSHVDGRQLQRIGLVPDFEVRPTIQGIQDGRDEVLEYALAYLKGNSPVA